MTVEASCTVVFAMGRTGSRSLARCIGNAGVPVHHVHALHDVVRRWEEAGRPFVKHWKRSRLLLRDTDDLRGPMSIVTPVRDPVARNLSDTFFRSTKARPAGVAPAAAQELRRFPKLLDWFDREFRPALGIDVFEHPFDWDAGHTTIERGNKRVLILRAELPDARKSAVISDFLGVRIRIDRSGAEPRELQTRDAYAAWLSQLAIPEAYLDEIYRSRLARHFYSAGQIRALREHWLSGRVRSPAGTGAVPAAPVAEPFHRQYVDRVASRLAAGEPHPTLGGNLKGGSFAQAGRGGLDLLVDWGMRPEHVCVDYGCGSLRIGQHIMNYLAPANYWGLDVTERFFEDGKARIGQDVVAARQPRLLVIDDAALARAAAASPDFVLCVGVLSHVPPSELDRFFRQLMAVTVAGTRTFLKFRTTDAAVRLSSTSWAHDRRTVASCLARHPVAWERVGGKVVTKAGVRMDDQWWRIERIAGASGGAGRQHGAR